MMTRVMAMTSITSIDMTTIIMMMTTAMLILPTENNDADGNVEIAYTIDVDHDDDNF